MFCSLIATASATILDAGASEVIGSGRVHQELNFAPPRLVNDLRADVAGCVEAGLFKAAGSGGRQGEADAIRSALYADPIARDRSVGNWDAFFALWERLDLVRQELAHGLSVDLCEV
jgi:hypothetical protein